jgi:hypothetical protein
MHTERFTCHQIASAFGSKNASITETGDAAMTMLVEYSKGGRYRPAVV